MQRPLRLLLAVTAAALLLQCSLVASSRPLAQRELDALLALRDGLDPFTVQQLRWTATSDACGAADCDEHTCNWAGVACSGSNVVGINITLAHLPPGQATGTLDDAVFSLPHLRYLAIPNQRLGGPLPQLPEGGTDSPLRHIDLHNNSFVGPLPETWAYLTLLTLDLSHNPHLSGAVPPVWKQLAPQTVNLSHTGICGTQADILTTWRGATVVLDSDLAPCRSAAASSHPSSSKSGARSPDDNDTHAKYSVLLSMYIVASIFIVTSVLFVVGHSCLCRTRPSAGPGMAPSANPPAPECAPQPPPGPPPTLIIMPGSQVCVGYPIEPIKAVKDDAGKGADQGGGGDVEMGLVGKPEGRERAVGGTAGDGAAAAPAAARAAACMPCTGGSCVRHSHNDPS